MDGASGLPFCSFTMGILPSQPPAASTGVSTPKLACNGNAFQIAQILTGTDSDLYASHRQRRRQKNGSVSQARGSCSRRTEGDRALAVTDTLHTFFHSAILSNFGNNFEDSRSNTLTSFDQFDIREAQTEEEFRVAAWLRAEAFSERQPYTRYVDSFKKKFAEQEYSALKRRVAGQFGRCICLLAVTRLSSHSESGQSRQEGGEVTGVIGTLDFSLLHPSPGEAFGGQGLPYGYIANVCVDKSARQRGVASALLQCAVNVGRDWGLNVIYVHAHATNKPACQLYAKKGFKILQAGATEKLVDDPLLLRLQL